MYLRRLSMRLYISVFTFLLILLLTAGCSRSVKEYSLDIDAFKDNATDTMRDSDGKPITGVVKRFFDSGELMSETFYNNGKRDRFHRIYYKSGELHLEFTSKNGKAAGTKSYYENGRIRFEIPFKDGEAEGVWKEYYENGEIEAEIAYKSGKKEGLTKYYFQTGVLEIQHKDNLVVSGICTTSAGKRTALTESEISGLNAEGRAVCE
jgi:antitoxin component YwqK of YwqJK toxin-antitoxin module